MKKSSSKVASSTAKVRAAFPIVGVGASAGGLEAFTELLKALPADSGMAFVLVQHLDPKHESALTHLLARATTMPVCEVTQNLLVEPDSIYVIPPNVQMAIEGGVLKLTPRGKAAGATRSIDFFFEALAQDQRERAIGVVLSGTASDGTLGLEAIKAEGGVTFAQDESAKYDSMPRSAIAAGVVDFVLAPVQIAAELSRIAKHPLLVGPAPLDVPGRVGVPPAGEGIPPPPTLSAAAKTRKDGSGRMPKPAGEPTPLPGALHSEAERESDQSDPKDAPLASGGKGTPRTGSQQAKREAAAEPDGAEAAKDGFKKILGILRNHCGVDFSLYKSSTIQRRVTRRLVLNKHETLAAYAVFLKGNAKELDALYSDVLISVTSFFRNPEAFDALKRKVFPKILAARGRDEPVRVWVLGCSTGQEAYSLAMTFAEAAGEDARSAKLQIFATDLNEALLEKARHGLYAKSLAQDVSPERLRRFFVEEEGGYRVSKLLREQVVFARQNVMSDPPFSRMDLITCRNLLIYLEPALQKKIFPAFHYALKPGGYLFLGASESIGTFTDLFVLADKKWKIFARKVAPTPTFRLPLPGAREMTALPEKRVRLAAVALPQGLGSDIHAQREADRISVSQFAPPGVLVDAAGHIMQFRGATGAYLEPPSGKASFDVLKMAREGLMLPLRAALAKAKREKKPVRREDVRVGSRAIALQVIPLRNLKEQCFLVLFEEAGGSELPGRVGLPPAGFGVSPERSSAAKKVRKGGTPTLPETRRLAELEREFAETRDFLQCVQEQNEAANEELQASSEELQSANEELQSINEELETSKEELESTNEELTTINDEMISRNTELNRANAYLNNVQVSIQTAILLLARDLTVVRFTPPAAKLFNLLATDVGRPIHGIRHNLDVPDLEVLLDEVLATVSLREREVRDKEGRWYALRVRPFLSLENKVDGVVLVLSDIDALKRTQDRAKTALDYAEGILRAAPVPFLVLRADLRVNTASETFYRNYHVERAATEGRLIYEIGNGQWNIPRLRELLEEIIPQKQVFNGFEVTHEFATIGTRTMLLNARRVDGAEDEPERILLAIEDITERKHTADALAASEERFRLAGRAVSNIVWTNTAHGLMEGEQVGWGNFTGQTQAEYQGYGWAATVHPDDAQPTIDAWNLAVAGKRMFQFEHRVRRHDGVWRRCSVRALPTLDPAGEIREWVGVHHDVTDERAAVDALFAAKEQAEAASRAKDDFLAALSHELRTPLTPVLMTASALETDTTLPLEVREQLAMIRRNVELEARLIDDLLDLTRISRGKLTIAPVPTDLHQLLHHTAEIVRSEGLGKQVRIVFVLAATRHHALADPTRLQQVFWNLIKNALKFTPTGGTITVSTRNDDEGGIVVSFEDTGVGISVDAMPHIFKAFEQGDVAGQHRYGGLGLGLAISQAIVEVHGGAIRADSQGAGYGATFSVILANVEAPAVSTHVTALPPRPSRALRLLVVEDHEATRTVLQRLLTRSGHTVTITSTMHEALTTFAAERFDAIISDLGLPDGSGLELMREIQRQRPVPGIALSGYGMEDDLRQTKEAGFFAHLVKPVNIDQLRQLLDQLSAQKLGP